MNSRYTEANLMYATSSRSRRRSITISPISPLGISTRPDRRSSASMSSTIARSRSGEMSLFSVAFFSPLKSFWGSKSSRLPSFLVTKKGTASMRSYVVKRCPHCRHSRLRRIASPTSESRESTTFRSWWPQYGQRMGYELFLNSVAEKRRDIDIAQVFGAELRALVGRDRPALDLLLGLGLGLAAETGGDHGDLDLALHGVVADDAEDDVGARVGCRADDLGRLLNLLQGDVLAGGDVEKDALGAVDRRLEQRAGNGLLGGVLGPGVAGAVADAHQRLTGVLHDRLDVGEVEVDDARLGDKVGDALDALAENVVRHAERFLEGRLGAGDLCEPVVGDDDERVYLAPQGLDALLGSVVADAALERERPRHDADGQRAGLFRQLGNDGRRPGPGATAHAGGDEDHVGFLDHCRQLGPALVGGVAAARPVTAGAQATGDLVAHLDLDVRLAALERLLVGVHCDELDLERFRDHAIDGVAATATTADDLDSRPPFVQLTLFHDD